MFDDFGSLCLTSCLKFPNEIQPSRDFSLLTVNDLTNKEKYDENQVDEKSLSVQEPKFASLVA